MPEQVDFSDSSVSRAAELGEMPATPFFEDFTLGKSGFVGLNYFRVVSLLRFRSSAFMRSRICSTMSSFFIVTFWEKESGAEKKR